MTYAYSLNAVIDNRGEFMNLNWAWRVIASICAVTFLYTLLSDTQNGALQALGGLAMLVLIAAAIVGIGQKIHDRNSTNQSDSE